VQPVKADQRSLTDKTPDEEVMGSETEASGSQASSGLERRQP
jgi:hypothetical protein